jgi:nucleoside-diphosphate-sugar epimerase
MSKQRVLVTGAGGFIGTFLCKKLSEDGYEIKALAMPGEHVEHLQSLDIKISIGDLTKPETIKGLSDDIDIVYHLAGRVTDWGPRKVFYNAIVDATKNLLDESAGKVSRFVYISSFCACGMGRHLRGVKEEDPAYKTGVSYGDAKLAWILSGIVEGLYAPFNVRPPATRAAVAIMGRDLDVDNTRAKKELGWKTRISYEEAMKTISAWIKEHYLI